MRQDDIVSLGRWSPEAIDGLLERSGSLSPGARIGTISEAFLETPYREATLVGGTETPERLVINLAEVDCFTFIDYVEALRRCDSFDQFRHNLVRVRYRLGTLSYDARNHFFTDWIDRNGSYLSDVTAEVGGGGVRTIRKLLNRRGDGTPFVPGIPPVERDITYLPVGTPLSTALHQLKTGDYAGIYSALDGLDVSHTGIVVENQGRIVFRHASSIESTRKVTDQDLLGYLNGKPGIVILRPR
jgi:hypothetical protein